MELKRHFDKNNFYLHHSNPSRFASGPWHSGVGPPVSVYFLVYRVLLSGTFTALLLWSMIINWEGGKWFIYLTSWGFFLCALSSYIATFVVCRGFFNQSMYSPNSSSNDLKSETEYMPVIYKIYWISYNVSTTAALFITILYWSILYNPEHDVGLGGFGLNFTVHGLNSILSMLEVVVGGPPSRLLHGFQSALFALVYVTFNLIYWGAGGMGRGDKDYVYPVLDWTNNPGLGVGIIFGGAVLLLLLHSLICCVAGVRSKLSKKMRSHILQNLGNMRPPDLENGNVNKAFVI